MLDMVRHVLDMRLGFRQTGSQGTLASGTGSGCIVSTGRVGGDGDAATVVWAGEMGHGRGRASQGDHAEAEEVCKLHDGVGGARTLKIWRSGYVNLGRGLERIRWVVRRIIGSTTG